MLEKLNNIINRLENNNAMLQTSGLEPRIHVEVLRENIPEIIDELKKFNTEGMHNIQKYNDLRKKLQDMFSNEEEDLCSIGETACCELGFYG